MSVSTPPGSTAAQKISCGRPSSASDLIRPPRPHLLALYAAAEGVPSVPLIEPMPMMRPPPLRRIRGQAARAQRKAPFRLTASTRSHCASVKSSIAPRSSTPALSTSTPGGPRRASRASKKRCTAAASETSQRAQNASAPGGGAGSPRDAHSASLAPAAWSSAAMARPMPRDAPVTTQTLPASGAPPADADPSPTLALGAPRERSAQLAVLLEHAGPGLHRDPALPAHRPAHLHAGVLGGD